MRMQQSRPPTCTRGPRCSSGSWSWASGRLPGGRRPRSARARARARVRAGRRRAWSASDSVSAWETRRLKVLATRRYPGPAFDELGDVEIGPLEPRRDVEALIVANEPVDPADFPALRLVANFGVGYDRLGVDRLHKS